MWGYDARTGVDDEHGHRHRSPREGTRCTAALVLVSFLATSSPRSGSAEEPPPPAPPAPSAPASPPSPAPSVPADRSPAATPPSEPTAAGSAAASAASEAAREAEAERARSLFREGLVFVDEERWPEAADRFRHVLEIRWSAAAAHNLGSALVELGKLVEARAALERVVSDADATPAIRAAAARMLEALAPRIGELSIEIAGGDAAGLELVLDDHTLPPEAIDAPVPIDPGYHVLVARREGVEVAREEIYLGSGAREIEVVLDPSDLPPEFEPPIGALVAPLVAVPPAAAAATAPSGVRRDDTEPWWVWVGGGVLATGLLTAAVVLFATDGEGAPEPLPGDLEPRVLRGRVDAP